MKRIIEEHYWRNRLKKLNILLRFIRYRVGDTNDGKIMDICLKLLAILRMMRREGKWYKGRIIHEENYTRIIITVHKRRVLIEYRWRISQKRGNFTPRYLSNYYILRLEIARSFTFISSAHERDNFFLLPLSFCSFISNLYTFEIYCPRRDRKMFVEGETFSLQ